MNPSIEHPVRDRAQWILRLLWAPDEYDRTNTPLYGVTRLMKATFLLDRKLDENFSVETGFDFTPDKYGPFDRGVYNAVSFLENDDLITADEPHKHNEKYDLVRYQLTDSGEDKAKRLYNDLPEEQRELVLWVKNKHALQKLGRLLTYVYNEYPEMTIESELV